VEFVNQVRALFPRKSSKQPAPKKQANAFIADAKGAGADEAEKAWEARLKAAAKPSAESVTRPNRVTKTLLMLSYVAAWIIELLLGVLLLLGLIGAGANGDEILIFLAIIFAAALVVGGAQLGAAICFERGNPTSALIVGWLPSISVFGILFFGMWVR